MQSKTTPKRTELKKFSARSSGETVLGLEIPPVCSLIVSSAADIA
jgi:hypothetical protein